MKNLTQLLILLAFFIGVDVMANTENIKVITLNLHGYHPMGEKQRWFEFKNGEIKAAPSDIFYFTWEEIVRGNKKRLDRLAYDMGKLEPDIVFLQEVAAGSPTGKGKEIFHKPPQNDQENGNIALRLRERLKDKGYEATVACRGNVGWITNQDTFKDKRIITKEGDTKTVIFDYGSNPYPEAILIEGFGILYKKPFKLIEGGLWHIEYNKDGHKCACQYALLERAGKIILAVNIHSGHKIDHFEQAVAIRKHISDFTYEHDEKEKIQGIIIAGDANARLYRPNKKEPEEFSEPTTGPWEVFIEGQFDLRIQSKDKIQKFQEELIKFNFDKKYKNWAMIEDKKAVRKRVEDAIKRFCQWQQFAQEKKLPIKMTECLSYITQKNKIKPLKNAPRTATKRKWRIDHIFVNEIFDIKNAFIIYDDSSWIELNSVSDHMGVYCEIGFKK